MSHRLPFQNVCQICSEFLISESLKSNEVVGAVSILSNQGHNKKELHLVHTAAGSVISLFQS